MSDSIIELFVRRAIEDSPGILELRSNVQRQGVLQEEQQTKIDRLVEVVVETHRKVDALIGLKQTLQRMGDRQDAIEDAHRRHVRNRRAHRSVET